MTATETQALSGPLVKGLTVASVILSLSISAVAAAPNSQPPQPDDKPASITPDYPKPAQDATVDGKPLQAVLNDKDYLDQLVRYVIGYDTWIHNFSDAEPEERLRTLMISEPLHMPGIDGVSTPQWLEVIRVRGCNRTYKRLVYATYHNGKPVFHAQIAGSTKTAPLVQHQTVTALRNHETLRAHAAGCDRAHKARVTAANLDEDWSASTATQWREIWTVQSCRGVTEMPVYFRVDESGGVTFRFQAPQ